MEMFSSSMNEYLLMILVVMYKRLKRFNYKFLVCFIVICMYVFLYIFV